MASRIRANLVRSPRASRWFDPWRDPNAWVKAAIFFAIVALFVSIYLEFAAPYIGANTGS
jgi:hypothetical protein